MNDAAGLDTSVTPASAPCPECTEVRTGRERYCERCGFDFLARGVTPSRAPSWLVTVVPDAEHFARTVPAGLSFPAVPAASRTLALSDTPVRVGRRRSGAEQQPDIDIADDPAVSRLHASLVRQDDGSWAVVDEGSVNGTTLNDDVRAITPHVLVSLNDGDRVHIGAWTTIVVTLAD